MKERNVHMDGEGWHATTCYDDIGCVSLLDTDILISVLQIAVSGTGQSFFKYSIEYRHHQMKYNLLFPGKVN